MLYRKITSYIEDYLKSDTDKILILEGARQIGKTWAMETFGKECFKYCVKFDFDRQQELKSVDRKSVV